MASAEEAWDYNLTAAERIAYEEEQAALELAQSSEAMAEYDARVMAYSLRRMAEVEAEQRARGDRFWGVDFRRAEEATMRWEVMNMTREDNLIRAIVDAERKAAAEVAAAHAEAQRRQAAYEQHREAMELAEMRTQEALQTKVDRYWGVELRARRMRDEALRKRRQAAAARKQREEAALAETHKQWAAMSATREEAKKKAEAAHQAQLREDYMKTFYGAESSSDIIAYTWPTAAVPELMHSHDDDPEGYLMDVVNSRDRVDAPVHTLHKLNPLRTAGRRRNPMTGGGPSHFQLMPDLRPNIGVGIPPVSHDPSPSYRPLQQLAELKTLEIKERLHDPRVGPTGPGGATLWPVPAEEARKTREVTLRGWLLPADGPDAPDGSSRPRLYAALWKSSLLTLFRSEEDCRSFYSGAREHVRLLRGYIDLEGAVAIKVRELTDDEKERLAPGYKPGTGSPRSAGAPADSGAESDAGSVRSTASDVGASGGKKRRRKSVAKRGRRKSASRPRRGSNVSDARSVSSAGSARSARSNASRADKGRRKSKSRGRRGSKAGAGDSDGAESPASAADGAKMSSAPLVRPAEPRILEIHCIGQVYLLRPDTTDARHARAKELADKEQELEAQIKKVDALQKDKEEKERVSAAAEKKGPHEGNYKLRVKAQAAAMKSELAHQALEKLEASLPGIRAAAKTAEYDEFKVWVDALTSAVSRRNAVVFHLTRDPAMDVPPSEVDMVDLSREVSDTVYGLTQSKLGPWSMPVSLMPLVEALHREARALGASEQADLLAHVDDDTTPDALSALAKKGEGKGEKPAKPEPKLVGKFLKGRVDKIQGRFGYIRPDDKSGDQDIFFFVEDARERVVSGDRVQFDTVLDTRDGQSGKDSRAVRIHRLVEVCYAMYEDLDTAMAHRTNVADLWCTESLAQDRQAGGGQRRRSAIFGGMSTGGSVAGGTSPRSVGGLSQTNGFSNTGGSLPSVSVPSPAMFGSHAASPSPKGKTKGRKGHGKKGMSKLARAPSPIDIGRGGRSGQPAGESPLPAIPHSPGNASPASAFGGGPATHSAKRGKRKKKRAVPAVA